MELKINHSYSFGTIDGSLGSSYTNMIVKQIMSSEEAAKAKDIYTEYSKIKKLTQNTQPLPLSADECTYVMFKNASSKDSTDTVILAYEFLVDIVEVKSKTLLIEIKNYTSPDYNAVIEALRSIGIENITCKLKDN